ncbi:hypothetical protein DPEC_G00187710 [Dallia pectoralis]|uniref:Uncharacterized protein n=1 Tax=Dallia pectoralis TaxID=75939 RepID=A0ACC2GBQ3_DALPE|nr:hypothetical protein DPEC_G00187710 [Dallia pectoralis]
MTTAFTTTTAVLTTTTVAPTTTTAASITTTAAPTTTTTSPTTTTASPTTKTSISSPTSSPTTTTTATATTKTTVSLATLYSAAAPIGKEGSLQLGFKMNRVFQSTYSDPTSIDYQDLALNVTSEVNHGYRKIYPLTYLRSSINKFTKGSIIVNMTLIFINQPSVPSSSIAIQNLIDSLKNDISFLDITDTSTISATAPTSTISAANTLRNPVGITIFVTMLTGLLILY